jgi:hypothetical protein
MKLIIAGSRTFTDYQLLCQTLAPQRHHIAEVLHGGARGADRLGFRWAVRHHVRSRCFAADWERFGKESAKIPGDSKANATLSATLGKNTRLP